MNLVFGIFFILVGAMFIRFINNKYANIDKERKGIRNKLYEKRQWIMCGYTVILFGIIVLFFYWYEWRLD